MLNLLGYHVGNLFKLLLPTQRPEGRGSCYEKWFEWWMNAVWIHSVIKKELNLDFFFSLVLFKDKYARNDPIYQIQEKDWLNFHHIFLNKFKNLTRFKNFLTQSRCWHEKSNHRISSIARLWQIGFPSCGKQNLMVTTSMLSGGHFIHGIWTFWLQ